MLHSKVAWSFEAEMARWGAAKCALRYSLRRCGSGVEIRVEPDEADDGLAYTLILGPLAYESLRLEYGTSKRFRPFGLFSLARAFPRMLLSPSGWRYLIKSATLRRPVGDVKVSVPSPYVNHFYRRGERDPFGDEIIERLAQLEGRRFAAEELAQVIFALRRETMSEERMKLYIEGMR